jgi:hypothetical protein
MAKLERRFRDRVGRFFRRLVRYSAKRAVPTRSPRRRLTPHKMACRLLPKTRRMFASFSYCRATVSVAERICWQAAIVCHPEPRRRRGTSHSELETHKLVCVIHDHERPLHSLGMTEITERRSLQNHAPSFPPGSKMRCHHLFETKTRSMSRHRN